MLVVYAARRNSLVSHSLYAPDHPWPAEAAEKALVSKKKKTSKRTKAAENVRMRLYWGVFSQNLKRVAVFDFDKKGEADKRAKELSKGGKSPHFVQKLKEEIKAE